MNDAESTPFVGRMVVHSPKLSAQHRLVAAITILVPAIGAALALAWAYRYGLHASTIVTAIVMYFLTTLGLTVGFHRYFTHRAFRGAKATTIGLAVLGMMSAQGPLLFWVASHRRHHAFSDTAGDCHSPRLCGAGVLGTVKGLWHAHLGWMFRGEITNVPMFVKDLLRDDLIVFLSRYYLVWVALGLLAPALVGYLLEGSVSAAIEGLLWGGLLRIFFVHQITWALNSLNHVFGRKMYASDDESRNIGWLAVMTLGEGWHNNHHAFPRSARFGHAWWQLDVGYLLVATLAAAGLCWDVSVPDEARRMTRLITQAGLRPGYPTSDP